MTITDDVPIAYATHYDGGSTTQANANANAHGQNDNGGDRPPATAPYAVPAVEQETVFAVVTGTPQPPSIAAVSGMSQSPGTQPQHLQPHNASQTQNENASKTCCCITCIIVSVVMVCCVLPIVIVIIVWVVVFREVSEEFSDDEYPPLFGDD